MRWWAATLVSALSLACTKNEGPREPAAHAAFGVFYGGQVQKRSEIAFEIDPAKQRHGFRIIFDPPPKADTKIEWELDIPGSGKGVPDQRGRKGRGRMTLLGRAVVRAGQKQLDEVMKFRPGDPLGMWNVRVVYEGRVLVDRPFLVYDRVARQKAMRDGAANP